MDFFSWVRGPAFNLAVAIFVIGVVWRLVEILMLGRAQSVSSPRGSAVASGLRTVITRSWPDPGTFKRAGLKSVGGYVFHIGFFVTLLLFVPHIELFHATFGIKWPGLSTAIVDPVAVVTLITLVGVLVHRLVHPVVRFLSTFQDYLTWGLTFLPLLTGYLAFHHMIDPYPVALGIHILSVELLMVVFPFTKLMHAFTLFLARWYNGAIAGRRGVAS